MTGYVIADDMTGANATACMLKNAGFSVCTAIGLDTVPEIQSEFDIVVVSTDSRSISPEEAYSRVQEAMRRIGPCGNPSGDSSGPAFVANRIDSTFRGNIGAETDGILDSMPEGTIAAVVPCSPEAGRLHIGGYLMVNGVPVNETSVGTDPKNPMKTGNTEKILLSQTKYPIQKITFSAFEGGSEGLLEAIREGMAKKCRIFLFDASTYGHMELIADALVQLKASFITVDPGPFTRVCAEKLARRKKRVLMAIGTVNPTTAEQYRHMKGLFRLNEVLVDMRRFTEGSAAAEEEIRRVLMEVEKGHGLAEIDAVVGSGIYPENRMDLAEDRRGANVVSQMMNDGLAAIVKALLNRYPGRYTGLYLSGGDVASSVCRGLHTAGIEPIQEVVPLAVLGALFQGDFPGLSVVTKGGSMGDAHALEKCVEALLL